MILDPLIDAIVNRPYETIRFVGILLLYLVIFGVVFTYIFRDYLRAHWYELQDTPFGILTAGIIHPIPGKSVAESTQHHFTSLLWRLGKEVMDVAVMPFHNLIQGLASILDTLREQLDSIRQQMAVMRQFLGTMAQDAMVRVETTTAGVLFDVLKMREQMKRSYALFQHVIYIVEHSKLFMESIINGPVGAFGKIADQIGLAAAVFTFGAPGIATWKNALCFNAITRVRLSSGQDKCIADIKPGDALFARSGSNTVTAVLSSRIVPEPGSFYAIAGTNMLVANDHVLQSCSLCSPEEQHRRPRRVGRYPCAHFVQVSEPSFLPSMIYCITTSAHMIPVSVPESDALLFFGDYTDTACTQLQHDALNQTLRLLNNRAPSDHVLPSLGLSPLKLKSEYISGMNAAARDHVLAMLINTNLVIGTVTIKPHTLDVYSHVLFPDMLLSARCIIWDVKSGRWILVCDSDEFQYVGKNEDTLYHFVSKSGTLAFHQTILRDVTELIEDDHVKDILEILCPSY
jgi:hypothetical protein